MMQFFRDNMRKIMLVVVVLFVISCFAISGGGRSGGGSSEESTDYVAAKVNGEEIMRSRIERMMYEWLQGSYGQAISSDQFPWIRSMLLDQIAVESEMNKEIAARGISVTDDEIKAEVRRIEDSFPTREIFMQALERSGISERDFRANIGSQLRSNKLIQQIVAPASVDETEKSSYYDMYKEFVFKQPEAFKSSIAHFSTKEAAEAFRGDLTGGKGWDEAIEARSADMIDSTPGDETIPIPVSELTGELAFIKDARMNAPTAPTEITSGDFMVVIKREKQAESILPYDEVSADIGRMLLGQKQQTMQTQFLQELRSRADVQVIDTEIFAMPTAPEPSPETPVSEDTALSADEAISPDAVPAPTSEDISEDKK